MSAGFWLRRKRIAAMKRKKAKIAAETEKATVTETNETPKKTAKKGGVKKNDNAGTV